MQTECHSFIKGFTETMGFGSGTEPVEPPRRPLGPNPGCITTLKDGNFAVSVDYDAHLAEDFGALNRKLSKERRLEEEALADKYFEKLLDPYGHDTYGSSKQLEAPLIKALYRFASDKLPMSGLRYENLSVYDHMERWSRPSDPFGTPFVGNYRVSIDKRALACAIKEMVDSQVDKERGDLEVKAELKVKETLTKQSERISWLMDQLHIEGNAHCAEIHALTRKNELAIKDLKESEICWHLDDISVSPKYWLKWQQTKANYKLALVLMGVFALLSLLTAIF